MSAKSDKNMAFVYLVDPIDEDLEDEITGMFEYSTDLDIEEIAHEKVQAKLLKRTGWVKTLTFPLEYVLMLVLLPKELRKEREKEQSLIWKFLTNKVSYSEFRESFVKLFG